MSGKNLPQIIIGKPSRTAKEASEDYAVKFRGLIKNADTISQIFTNGVSIQNAHNISLFFCYFLVSFVKLDYKGDVAETVPLYTMPTILWQLIAASLLEKYNYHQPIEPCFIFDFVITEDIFNYYPMGQYEYLLLLDYFNIDPSDVEWHFMVTI